MDRCGVEMSKDGLLTTMLQMTKHEMKNLQPPAKGRDLRDDFDPTYERVAHQVKAPPGSESIFPVSVDLATVRVTAAPTSTPPPPCADYSYGAGQTLPPIRCRRTNQSLLLKEVVSSSVHGVP